MTGYEHLIWLVPAALAIIVVATLSLESLLLITLFLTPLSVQISYFTGEAGLDLSLPTEPVMALLLLVTVYKLTVTGEFSVRLLRHPVTIIIVLYLVWTFITSVTSTMPGVSFKALAYRLWFISGFYLIAAQLFMKKGDGRRYIFAYSAGLAVVVIYFLVRVGGEGLLNQKFAHSACYPFYNDHTSFGASIAFLLPPLSIMLFRKNRLYAYSLLTGFIVLFVTGFILSYSRAAWVSLLVSLSAAALLWIRLPLRALGLAVAGVLVGLILSSGWIWQKMDSTTEDSSADLAQHLRSSSNITTDQSNLERINRWKCAVKMFTVRPLMGWGPGTYQFQYAPFQMAGDRTIISTNFGDVGSAHSEYLGALSETGFPGAILYTAIVLSVLLTGVGLWYREGRTSRGYLALAVVTGLMTYMIHGIMNNFLDTDKIASLWWGFSAMIVAQDISGETN